MSPGMPNGRRSLEARIRRYAVEVAAAEGRLALAVATTVVAQMLPRGVAGGVVKGGTAMQLRLGHAGSRLSQDFDAARAGSVEEFEHALSVNLGEGWNGFTGTLVSRPGRTPRGVPAGYVMRPYTIRLGFRGGQTWRAVAFELGHDEIGDAADAEYVLADEIARLFREVGLPAPSPVPVLAAHHQIAQKLHACTTESNDRAHDLVDLQPLVGSSEVDYPTTAETPRRLFRARQQQPGHRRCGGSRAGTSSTPRPPSVCRYSRHWMGPSNGPTHSSSGSTSTALAERRIKPHPVGQKASVRRGMLPAWARVLSGLHPIPLTWIRTAFSGGIPPLPK